VGNPVRTGRDVDSAGRVADFPVVEAELESEDKAGNEAVLVASPELLPESVADESDDAADVAVGIATLPVLLRVGRSVDWAAAVDVPSMAMRRRADAGIRRAREDCMLAKGDLWLGLVCVSSQQRSVDTSLDRFTTLRESCKLGTQATGWSQPSVLTSIVEGGVTAQRSDQVESRRACSEDTVCWG
jgi:hypothetical protein